MCGNGFLLWSWRFAQDKLHLEQREVPLDAADVIPTGFRFCRRAVIFQMDNEPDHASKLPEAKEDQGLVACMDFQFTVTRPQNSLNIFGNL